MNFSWSSDLNSKVYKNGLTIRNRVFVKEQQVPAEMEIDELEDQTIYVVGYLDDTPVATARIFPIEQNTYKVQRVAVLSNQRGKQLGKKLMLEIERYASENSRNRLILGAQDHAIGFYSALNYSIISEGYLDAGIPHHDMEKKLATIKKP